MNRNTRRFLKKFSRKARVPAAYVVILAVGLAAFLLSLHSCPGECGNTPSSDNSGGVNVIVETR